MNMNTFDSLESVKAFAGYRGAVFEPKHGHCSSRI
jgi:hypothetical protein